MPQRINTQYFNTEGFNTQGLNTQRLHNSATKQIGMTFIEVLEECLGVKAVKNLMPMQPGDGPSTYADIDDLSKDVGFKPSTPIEDGIKKFVKWYREYYG